MTRLKLPLDGKTVVVTGAARGLGAEVARQAHRAGAAVALLDIDLAAATTVADSLGSRALAVAADVRDPGALELASASVLSAFGGIDVLVANAGVAPPSDTVLTIDPDAFERTVQTNLLGQWRTIRATLPSIVARRGHVVVSSIYAFFNGALNASYAASKAGAEQLTRALRVELAAHGATAGVAYFGFIHTALAATTFAQPQVITARRALPAFVSKPMPADAAAVIRGVQTRAARIVAPRWVGPALRTRGLLDPLADRLLTSRLARAVEQAEAAQRRRADT